MSFKALIGDGQTADKAKDSHGKYVFVYDHTFQRLNI